MQRFNSSLIHLRVLLGVCLCLLALHGAAMAAPVAIQVSEGIAPGTLVGVYGGGFTGTPLVKFVETGTVVTPSVVDSAGRFLMFIFPSVTAGAYTLNFSTDGGVTWGAGNPNHTVYINQATPRWASDTKIYSGLKMRLFGRNFSASEFGGTNNTQVQLAPTAGGSNLACTVTATTPYCVSFTVPSGVTVGNTYYIQVRNNAPGCGGNWVTLVNYPDITQTTVTAVAAPTYTLAQNLNVGWATDYHWTNIVNVQTQYGAKGDGVTDDTAAFQNAIDAVTSAGGGVVYIPNATYCLDGQFHLGTGVVLNGQSESGTILQMHLNNPSTTDNYFGDYCSVLSGASGQMGLANLTIQGVLSNPGNPVRCDAGVNLTGVDTFIYNCVLDFSFSSNYPYGVNNQYGGWKALNMGGDLNSLLRSSTIKAAEPGYFWANSRATVDSNTFDWVDWAIETCSDKYILTNNTATAHWQTPANGHTNDPKGFWSSCYNGAYPVWCTYAAYNSCTDIISNTEDGGVALSMDGGATFANGYATASSSSGVTFTANAVNTTGYWGTQSWSGPWQVRIVKGTGMGQCRSMTGYTNNGNNNYTLTLSQPWDIRPDTTSYITIGRFHVNVVSEHETGYHHNGGGFWIGYNGQDDVCADMNDTQTSCVCSNGIFQGPTDTLGGPNFFTVFKRNTLTSGCSDANAGTSFCSGALYMDAQDGWNNGQTAPYPAFSSALYGTEIRGNTVNNVTSSSQTVAGISLDTSDSRPAIGDDTLATIIEGNTIENQPIGILFRNNYEDGLTRNFSYTALRNNTFTSVTTPLAENNTSQNTILFDTTLAPPTKVNCGASAVSPFSADFYNTSTNTATTGNTINTANVSNPAPVAVYQSCRWGPSNYTFYGLTSGGSYTVRLHFCEFVYSSAGKREFNVSINGTQVLTNFDVYATAGGEYVALVEQFVVNATSSGNIVISFTNGAADQAIINGIEVNANAQVVAPSFTPVAGTYSSAQSVTISTTTNGATIRYTTDGSLPSETHGTVYSSPVNISATTTLQAIAYKSGMTDSSITSGVYTIQSQCAAPTFSPGAGTYISTQSVAISSTTSGASIYYTIDGSTPSGSHGTLFSSPVSINSTTPLQAIAIKSGLSNSSVTSGTFTISPSGDNLFGTGTPSGSTMNDAAYELGMKFQASVSGQITALRVYRPTGGPSSYTAHLWSSSGTLLATTTINAPTAGTWVEGFLSTPVTITANTTYVVSYSLPSGSYYEYTSQGLANKVSSGHLSTVVGSNGVYNTTPGSFPSGSYNNTNYYADVRFKAIEQIDCGSSSAVSPFVADSMYSGGSTSSTTNTITTAGIANAAPMAVYQTCRWGAMTYTITGLFPSTNYTVRLHFAEFYWTAIGKREFNVAINSTSVLTNFDIFATAGANTACVQSFSATSNSSGQITISFTVGAADQPCIMGIETL